MIQIKFPKKHLQVRVVTFFIFPLGKRAEYTFVFVQYLTITLLRARGGWLVFWHSQKSSERLLTVVQQPVPKTLTNTKRKGEGIAHQTREVTERRWTEKNKRQGESKAVLLVEYLR